MKLKLRRVGNGYGLILPQSKLPSAPSLRIAVVGVGGIGDPLVDVSHPLIPTAAGDWNSGMSHPGRRADRIRTPIVSTRFSGTDEAMKPKQ